MPDGPEVPLLDGSAKLWVAIWVGLVSQSVPNCGEHTVSHLQSQSGCIMMPLSPLYQLQRLASLTALTSTSSNWQPVAQLVAAFQSEGVKSHTFRGNRPSSNFGLAHQIDALRQRGLIKGGTLDNALVCGSEGWLNLKICK